MLDLFIKPVYAQCPVCVITVGGGLLIAKKLGIDDLLVSIWLSGLNSTIAFWLSSKMKNKSLDKPFLWSIGFYVITVVYLILSKQIGYSKNTFLGIDKIMFGLTLGFILFLISFFTDKTIRKKNNGKVLFYYQKVVIPLTLLIIITIIFSFLIK